MTELHVYDIAMARVWEKSKAEIQVIFNYLEGLLHDYPCTLIDIRFKRSTDPGMRYKLVTNIRQDSIYNVEPGLYQKIDTALRNEYFITLKPYWDQLNKAFRQKLSVVIFDNKGIVCYLVDNEEPVKFYPTGEPNGESFPKDYDALLRELLGPLNLLVVGHIIPLLVQYARSESKTKEARYLAVYNASNGQFDKLVKDLKKLQRMKNRN